jgi:hypothetical protein
MVPSKLKRQLHTKYSHLCDKPNEYFRRHRVDQTRQAKQWTTITNISDKAKKQTMPLPKPLQKKIKPHTITESKILPACCRIANIFGEEYEKRF